MSETKISSFVGNSRKVIRQRIKRRKEWLARTDFGANSKKKRGALGLATPPNHEDQSFHVTVVSATNLLFKPGEKEITPNVYCVVWISPFKGYLKLTNVKKGSNPRWEESMHFNISDPEPNVLFIEVYHDGGLRRKSLLGSTGVPLSNLKLREKKTRNITVPLYPKNTGHIHLLLRPEDFSNDVEEDSVPIWMDLSGIISKKSGRGLKSILRNSISKEDDQRLDEEYNVKMLDEVYDQLQTGDIMLNSATGTFSQSIQLGTQSDWSHVGMIVVDPPQSIRDKYILPENESVFIFESDSETYDERKGAGVQLIPFRFWLMDYTNDDPNQFTVIRQLLLPDRLKKQSPWETFPNLEAKMLNLHGTSYEKRALDMVRSIRRRNVNNDYSTVFCSELVASCYCSMGLFAQNIVASNFTPKVFSSQEKKAPVTSFLLQGATLGEEFRVRVDLPQGWSPDEYLALHFNSVLKTGSEITTKVS
eukprot:gb/GECH01009876.1/.p1 GENE.gb/GECH01009876.1/~~gb/GECH01009876.1/.p1  ORF type:complete len:476 (+),score=101.76 gb/GECH01009876.1/:1-1428(+)